IDDITRQEYAEDRSLANFGIAEDEAAGLLDDAVHHRQSEARSLADFLGCEEWLEYLFQNVGGDPGAGVLDLDDHIVRRDEFAIPEGRSRLRACIPSPHVQIAAFRHGNAHVHGKVHHHLLELADIDPYRPQIASMIDLELDLVANQTGKQH